MKKESKNLGIRKACPSCGVAIVLNGNFQAGANWITKCWNCNDEKGKPTQVQIIIEVKATAETIKFTGLKIKGIKLFGIETIN